MVRHDFGESLLAAPDDTDVHSEVWMLGARVLLPALLPLLPSSTACEASLSSTSGASYSGAGTGE